MLSPVTCSAPWPVEGEPVNMRTPLAGVMRSKPLRDSIHPGMLASPTLHRVLCTYFVHLEPLCFHLFVVLFCFSSYYNLFTTYLFILPVFPNKI